MRSSNFTEFGERRLFDTSVLGPFFRLFDLLFTGVFRLRERIYCFIVVGIVLVLLSCHMIHCPIIDWCSPVTVQLNSKSILTSHNLEETLFTPVATPRVLYTPEWNSVLFTPTNDSDFVVSSSIYSRIIIDTFFIVSVEVRSSVHGASNRSSIVNLVHHVFLTMNKPILRHLINIVSRWDITSITR